MRNPDFIGRPAARAVVDFPIAPAIAVAAAARVELGEASRHGRSADQAATLRRMFAGPTLRVLPVLLPEAHCATRASWIAKLAAGFARHGERTLVVDAARLHVAAALGLRARFDLLHALRGECTNEQVLLDAGPNLSIVPAARALALAEDSRLSLTALLGPLKRELQGHRGCDLVLLLLPGSAEEAVARLPAGDILVPILPEAPSMTQSVREIERILARQVEREFEQPAAQPVKPAFRLLFLGMDTQAAAKLTEQLSSRCSPLLRLAGAVRIGRDLGEVVRAAGDWSLATLRWTR
jgi:hypothetical protein